MEQLGEQLRCAGFALRGHLTPDSAWALVRGLIGIMGMTEVPGGMCYPYPLNGRGGVGFTIFQPITESFLAIDAWTDLGGGYLLVCSCTTFVLSAVLDCIEAAGFHISEYFYRPLAVGAPTNRCRLDGSMGSGTGD